MRTGITLALVLVTVFATVNVAAEQTVFNEVSNHYEAIRQALIEESTDGLATHAQAIADAVAALARDFSAPAAGVSEDDAAAVKALLPEVTEKAEKLAAAEGLADTRQMLAALTQPLVRWQNLVEGPRPVVVYCAMEKKAWLQPDEPVGNPYAPSMLRCGDVVQR